MSQRLVVEATGLGLRGALLADGRLIEVHDLDLLAEPVTDTFFLGRVTAVDPRLNAAFVEIGRGQPALLNAKDARHAKPGSERRPIRELLQEGQSLIVQGLREPAENKGARVTTDLKLAGFHLIFRPLAAAAELGGPARGAERQALRERGLQLFPGAPVALRRLAAAASDELLLAEQNALVRRWAALQAAAEARRAPGPLATDEPALDRLLQQVLAPGLATIALAEPSLVARARQLLEGALQPHGIGLVRLDPGEAAFEQTEVAASLELALGREIPLRGGGRLIIESTAACVAVDVDGEGRPALDVDLEAAAAIAQLVRLRNFGGTIIVDFIDLPTRALQQRLDGALRRAFRDDPLPVELHPVSPLGIAQISRARRGTTLDALFTRPCPACAGSGRVPSLRARAEELVRSLRQAVPPPATLRTATDLGRYLEGPLHSYWREAFPGLRVTSDGRLPPGGFELG